MNAGVGLRARYWSIGAVTIAVLAGISSVLLAPLATYREVPSPDGEFIAIAKAPLLYAFVPVMPGQSGDRPGRVMVVRRDGRSCGSADVEMVAMVGAMRWRLDGKPREAGIVATATWNLDTCTVDIMSR